MRGQFWSHDDMAVVRETLGVPVTELSESVSARELLARYPNLLYWFERHPVVALLAFTGCAVVGGLLIFAGLAALGVTSTTVWL
jgi:hypothetical protein